MQAPSSNHRQIDGVRLECPPPFFGHDDRSIVGQKSVNKIDTSHESIAAGNNRWLWYVNQFLVARAPSSGLRHGSNISIVCSHNHAFVIDPLLSCMRLCHTPRSSFFMIEVFIRGHFVNLFSRAVPLAFMFVSRRWTRRSYAVKKLSRNTSWHARSWM